MSRVTRRALEQTVVGLAIEVARESESSGPGAEFPAEGTLVTVTDIDLRLWRAALKLASFRTRRPRARQKAGA